MPPTTREQLARFAFGTWVVGGIIWVLVTGYVTDVLWGYGAEVTFQYVHPTPEQAARYTEISRCEELRDFLCIGSIGYAILGAVLFRRRGCVAFGLAAAIVALSWLAVMAVGLGHL
ncbi:unnamed protein product [Gemmata massiliana]|uniref:Uncharacterized protein n=1 Tax=Gemmata massiliana TaxID=1210884 RepID=A0A6P2CZ02_9BACT|nr:hypothetical protein [Gemmata massiliana]VTR93024.1 unnamed protein product [Gemmata massiliana]